MCTASSDVCKPHRSSECYINKCGVTSYHQEEKPSKLSQDAVDKGGGGRCVPNTSTPRPHHCLGKEVALKAVCAYSDAMHLWASDPVDPGIKS